MPLLGQEDWMARMNYQQLKNTVIEAAGQGWGSDIHGLHPIPGMVIGTEFGKPREGVGPPRPGVY
jgi:hypothetical protein